MLSYIIHALYHTRSTAGGFTAQDTLRYVWLLQTMVMVVLSFGWYDLLLTIRSGDVVTDLSNPCDFFWYSFTRQTDRSTYYLLFRGIPTYATRPLVFGPGTPGGDTLGLSFGLP